MRMKVIKESIELIRMELMLVWYWNLKMKSIDYALHMAEYFEEHRGKFCTPEAEERLEKIRITCLKEAKE